MKKIKKQSIPNVMNLFLMVKAMLKRFGFFFNLHQDFLIEKKFLLGQRWRFLLKYPEKSIYKEKLITVPSAFLFENYYVIGAGKYV